MKIRYQTHISPLDYDDINQQTSAVMIDAVKRAEVQQLLVGRTWPDRNPVNAARRFAARCGNEPQPLWVDNFLSDFKSLNLDILFKFLNIVFSNLKANVSLRILSRHTKGSRTISPETMINELYQSGMTSYLASHLQWRVYQPRQQSHTWLDLHRRELILASRQCAFTMPPARIVVGQDNVGNEADSVSDYSSSHTAQQIWRDATAILPKS